MIICPDGDGNVDGHNHISVCLAIAETSPIQSCWEVNATFSFLFFDQIHGKYLVMRGMEQHFHNIKTKWGFSKCISHETFRVPSNGYLVNDRCVFGVDVYIIKNHGVGECLSPSLNGMKSYKHEWNIFEFTKLKTIVYSQEFTIGVTNGYWFGAPNICWGWAEFMPLSELKVTKKNFIVEDYCILEAAVSVLQVVNDILTLGNFPPMDNVVSSLP
ncbi:hypothetical protein H5410_056308 [Solanum commersonii]|uniref:MATH domain-containing protein n=1 Tax=Solanum commersonii TaxID=4109 RepID=A0A9J5WMR3_SOLCO|nr:hypothetical protein H5410_056308 [Solanum commersonii]